MPRKATINKEDRIPVPPPQDDKWMAYVRGKVDDSSDTRTTWINNQVKFNKMRMRIKKAKTFPFVGCSNIKMPTAEIKIRKVKAALCNVIFGIRPIVTCIPPPSGSYETALKVEKLLDHLIMERTDIYNKSVIAIDQELEQGFQLIKPYWRLEVTKRQETFRISDLTLDEAMFLYDGATTDQMVREFLINKFDIDMDDRIADDNEAAISEAVASIHTPEFKFYVQDIVHDCFDAEVYSPEHCYVPVDSPYNPQSTSGLTYEYYLPYHRLKTNSIYFDWNIEGVKAIGDFKGVKYDEQYQREFNMDQQEGIDRLNSKSELVRIWEHHGWYDLNGDGVDEKCIIICAPDFNKTLKKHGLDNYNGKFSCIKLFYELTRDRWYSHRGIIEIAEDLIKEIDIQHNMKIDQQTIRNAPMYLYRAGMVNPNLIQMIPNQAIPVRGLQPLRDTLDVLNNQNPNVEFSYEREQQILESKLEELIGQLDYTLQSQINRRQPRTLGEVEMQAQAAQQVFGLDATMHINQFTELFNFLWDLWCQYGPDEYEFKYFGPNGWEQVKFSKEEVQGKYKIVVRGNDRNTNPQVRLQKASQVLLAAKDPVLAQAGVVTPPQMINSLKRFYQYLEVENWEELVNLQWQPPPPPPPATIVKPDFNSLPPGEQVQVVASAGIQPDIQGRAMMKMEEIEDKSDEKRNESEKIKSKGASDAKPK